MTCVSFCMTHDDPEIQSEVVVRECAMAVLPPRHRFAQRQEIALKELHAERFVSFGLTQSKLARFLRDCCIEAGFTPKIEQEVVEVQTLLCLVRQGLGVALVPSSSQQLTTGGVVFAVEWTTAGGVALCALPDRRYVAGATAVSRYRTPVRRNTLR